MTDTYEHQIPLGPMCYDMAARAVRQFGALQDEWEFGMLLDLAKSHGVRTMVEIGSYTGGSLWAWRQVVPNVLAVTVTLETSPGMFHSHGASMVYGDSTAQDTQTRLADILMDRPVDLVFIDGGHDFATALSDFRWALELVEHGFIGLHDINLHRRFPIADFDGPRRLWAETKGLFSTWEIANKDD